ncbi:eukaryotic translation initiation factor 3 subunit, putative [Entamoeba invadens IP1]|uniref:Serine-threonine kinase receptor-associated protein n=1 Tax=Entamoeba invadens IP1 TaxID=370355 RepID=A0A0A1U4G0_ENTIV|nr:eukaryotic translation initiation factor 3 subunit, putative [Entamoeba invadens IP1]ELP87751.1 eukaryotic translation initiation factor 3 subunit, putative [Entamoeba invadens IP1]|eukprot:XP_004254522.1 eukaryotic translation initiation factor 3 subunit, putative [Entamoeba invadens IP1]
MSQRGVTITSTVLKGHEGPITKLELTREGDYFVSCSNDKTAMLWKVDPLTSMGVYTCDGAVSDCTISADGMRLYLASRDGSVFCFELETGKKLLTKLMAKGNYSPVRVVELSPNNEKLMVVTASFKSFVSSVYVVDPQIESPTAVYSQERPPLTKAKWITNDTIIVGDELGHLVVKDTRTNGQGVRFESHKNEITDIESDSYDILLGTTGKDGKSFVHDIRKPEDVISVFESGYPLQSIGFAPFTDYYAVGGGQDKAMMTMTQRDMSMLMTTFVNAIDGQEIVRLPGHFGTINTIVFAQDGKSVFTGSDDGCIRVSPLSNDVKSGLMGKKITSTLFKFVYNYDDDFTVESTEQGLNEQYKFTNGSSQFFLQARNLEKTVTIEKGVLAELQTMGLVGPNDTVSSSCKIKTVGKLQTRVFFFTKQNETAKIAMALFEKNGVFFQMLSTASAEQEDVETLLEGFDLSEVKQSHRVEKSGCKTNLLEIEDFSVMIPDFFKEECGIYTGRFRVYDDEEDTRINVSFGVDDVKSEKAFKSRFEQMWGVVDATVVELNIKNKKWKVMTFTTKENVYDVKYHFFAYLEQTHKYYSVWMGFEKQRSNLMCLLSLILSTFNVKDQKRNRCTDVVVFYHFNPMYSLLCPTKCSDIHSAEEHGLISDILPSMFVDTNTNFRFFCSVMPLEGVSQDTAKEIIKMEVEQMKAEKKTVLISSTSEKFNGFESWCQICTTTIKDIQVMCLVRYVYFRNPDVYVRFSYSAPPEYFTEYFVKYNVVDLMQSIDLSLLNC